MSRAKLSSCIFIGMMLVVYANQGVAQPTLTQHLPGDCIWALVINDPLALPEKSGMEDFYRELGQVPVWDLISETVRATGNADSEQIQEVVEKIREGFVVISSKVDWSVLAGEEIAIGLWPKYGTIIPAGVVIIKVRDGEQEQMAIQLHRLWAMLARVFKLPSVVPEDIEDGYTASLSFTGAMTLDLSYAISGNIAVIGTDPIEVRQRVRPAQPGTQLYEKMAASQWSKVQGQIHDPLTVDFYNFEILSKYLEGVIGFGITTAGDLVDDELRSHIHYFSHELLKLVHSCGTLMNVLGVDNEGIITNGYWQLNAHTPDYIKNLLVNKNVPPRLLEAFPEQAEQVTALSMDWLPSLYRYLIHVVQNHPQRGAIWISEYKKMLGQFDPEKDVFPLIGDGFMLAQIDSGEGIDAFQQPDMTELDADKLPKIGFILELNDQAAVKKHFDELKEMAELFTRQASDMGAVVFTEEREGVGASSTLISLTDDGGQTISLQYAIIDDHLFFGFPDSVYKDLRKVWKIQPDERQNLPLVQLVNTHALSNPVAVNISDLSQSLESAENQLKTMSTTLGMASDGITAIDDENLTVVLHLIENLSSVGLDLLRSIPPFKHQISSMAWDGEGYLFKDRILK